MKLANLQIENYKCVEDSTPFIVDQVTCLLGKNEAGKSAILEALYKLKPVEKDKANFSEIDYPRRFLKTYRERQDRKDANVVTSVWDLEDADLEFLAEELCPNVLGDKKVTLKKGYDNRLTWDAPLNEHALVEATLAAVPLSADEKTSFQGATTIAELAQKLDGVPSRSESQNKLLAELKAKYPQGVNDVLAKLLEKRLPTFLYFTEYVKEVQQHFAMLPPGIPNFDHYKPVEHLLSLKPNEVAQLPDLDQALSRFEMVFSDLNQLL